MSIRDLLKKSNPGRKLDSDDLGLSSKANQQDVRTINQDGTFNIIRKGEHVHIYHRLISMSWTVFFLYVLVAFSIINCFFAACYMLLGVENIVGSSSGSYFIDFVYAFHFSVQTMTTVGYGVMHPDSIATGILASFEALVGLLSFALATGMIYGRFSKPSADIKFTKHALIAPYEDQWSLQIRMANKRSHDIMNVRTRVLLIMDDIVNGEKKRLYQNVKLELDHIQFMPLNWTLVHVINDSSPLFGLSPEDLKKRHVEILITLGAYDDSFSKEVHTRTSYRYPEIIWNARFMPAYAINQKGQTIFDLDKLDDYEHVDVNPTTGAV